MFEFLLTQILKSQCLLIKTAWLQQMRSGWSGQEGGEQVEAERVGVIGTEKRAPSLSSTSTCWANSFLIRVTGLLLTTWGRETRRENSFPYYQSIAACVSPAWSRFVVGKVVSQPRFFFLLLSTLTKQNRRVSDEQTVRAHCSFNSMSCMTACMSAFTRVGVNMSRADVLHWACAKCSTCCRNAEGQSVSAQRCCRSFDLLLFLYSCNNRDAADCGGTRAEWRRAGWINASGQEEQGDEETRAPIWASRLCLSPVEGDSAFNSTAKLHRELISPKSFRNLPQVQVTLTHLLTHPQARQRD